MGLNRRSILSHASFIQVENFIYLLETLFLAWLKMPLKIEEKSVTIEVIGGNHTRAALLMWKGFRDPYVYMTIYDGLKDEKALQIGLHHKEVNKWARPMAFLEKVNIITNLNQDTKAIGSVFQKKEDSSW